MQTTVNHRRAQSFWDKTAPKYARKQISDPDAYEEKIRRVSALLRPTDRILEIGCGTGSTALRLAPACAHVTGTDISRKMLEIARGKLGEGAPENVSFLQAGADEMMPDRPFDAICAFSLLHLVEDLPAVLKAVRAQLQPGGRFISKTVCLRQGPLPLRIFLRTLIGVLMALRIAPPVKALSEAQMIEALEAAGFEIEEVRYFGKSRLNPFIVARRPLQ